MFSLYADVIDAFSLPLMLPPLFAFFHADALFRRQH